MATSYTVHGRPPVQVQIKSQSSVNTKLQQHLAAVGSLERQLKAIEVTDKENTIVGHYRFHLFVLVNVAGYVPFTDPCITIWYHALSMG